MNWRKFRDDEQGAVAVLVALSMTVLLGFAAFAVDFGMLSSVKQSLQNAADAAALAGAAELADGANASAVQLAVRSYADKNGVAEGDSSVTAESSVSGSVVTVNVSRTVEMGFSVVLTGKQTRTVRASAAAEATTIFGACPYALFAGQDINDDGIGITANGNDMVIESPIHSNSNITIKHPTLVGENTVATAVNTTSVSGEGWLPHSPRIPMPSYASIQGKFLNTVTYSGSVTLKKSYTLSDFVYERAAESGISSDVLRREGLTIYISGSMGCNGNLSFTTTDFPVNLIAAGSIDLRGCTLASTRECPMTVISETGNVTVNGGGTSFFGIVFAPEGNVTLNGNDATIIGSVIAQNITKNGSHLTVKNDEAADDYTPVAKVRLVA